MKEHMSIRITATKASVIASFGGTYLLDISPSVTENAWIFFEILQCTTSKNNLTPSSIIENLFIEFYPSKLENFYSIGLFFQPRQRLFQQLVQLLVAYKACLLESATVVSLKLWTTGEKLVIYHKQ